MSFLSECFYNLLLVFNFQIFYSNLLVMLFLVVIVIRIQRTCWMCVLMSSIRFVLLSFNISTLRFLEDIVFMIVILWDVLGLALCPSGQFLETVLVGLRRMYIFLVFRYLNTNVNYNNLVIYVLQIFLFSSKEFIYILIIIFN